MNESPTYRVRYRFRVQKMLEIPDKEHRFALAGQEVVLSSQIPDKAIRDDDWLVMNARGFSTEEAARDFGRKLKAASELSSVVARLGINSGVDQPTSGFGKVVKDAVFAKEGILLRDNVHGIDVFPDDPRVRIASFTAKGTIRSQPNPFLAELEVLMPLAEGASQRIHDIILLLNYALTRTDPVAMIVFSVSAVEMLGQNEKWSTPQRQLLAELARAAEASEAGTAEERTEIASAIGRSLQKLSLRQGVLRLLDSLDLPDLKSKWDALYAERSMLVHGLAPKPGVDYSDLAFRTVSLCGHILLTAIGREVEPATKHLKTHYAL